MSNPVRPPGCAVTNLATKTSTFDEFHDDSLLALSCPVRDRITTTQQCAIPSGQPSFQKSIRRKRVCHMKNSLRNPESDRHRFEGGAVNQRDQVNVRSV